MKSSVSILLLLFMLCTTSAIADKKYVESKPVGVLTQKAVDRGHSEGKLCLDAKGSGYSPGAVIKVGDYRYVCKEVLQFIKGEARQSAIGWTYFER